jgi:hypothetical protein
MKCSICEKEIEKKYHNGKMFWSGGNNAQPINDGRCCDTCDCLIVIPARMGMSGATAVEFGKTMLFMRTNPSLIGVEEE